jgi:hypothetical protein
MRRILLAFVGVAISAVMGGKIGDCEKNCGIDFGKCLITTGDFKECLKTQAGCSLDCLKGLKVQYASTKVKSDMGVCQKNCGIDYGKCLVTTFDMKSCTSAQAACALDCLKGVKTPKGPEVMMNVQSEVGVCEKNCGLDFGKCLITTGDFKTCVKTQAACALDCLKSVQGGYIAKDVGVCQKNCAIDYSKCLITTFDMKTCTQQEAGCALDCLKTVKSDNPHVEGLKCSACKLAAGTAEKIIARAGCAAASAAILAATGPFGAPLVAACPFISSLILNKTFSTEKVCQHIRMC